MLDAFRSDAKFALRTLARQPGFVAVTVFTLALGIGANTAVFSVLNGVILRPLPYDAPDRLVRLYNATEGGEPKQYMAGPDLVDLSRTVSAFSAMGLMFTYRQTGVDLTGGGEPRRVIALQVNAGYFPTYAATPQLGRTFTAEETRGDSRVVVLSNRLWREQTNGDPGIIGRTLTLDGEAWTVIGVMRPGFLDVVGGDVAAWIPLDMRNAEDNTRGNHYLTAVARLAPGATLAQAREQIRAREARWREEYPDAYDQRVVAVYPLHEDVTGDASRTLLVLMGAAGLVLLIACVNVANLMLVRTVARMREFAVRTAMGAARARVAGQQLVESLLVAVAGGVIGTAVAFWGVKLLLAVSPESLARAEEIGFDPWLLGFAIAVTGLTGILFGAAPALQASAADPNTSLRDASRGSTSGTGQRAVRNVLVTAQLALALVLLVGAGILMRSFSALQSIDLGVRPDSVATFEVHLPNQRYVDPAERARFHQTYLERLRALPEVQAAGATSWLPGNGNYHWWGVGVLDANGERQWTGAQVRVIEGDYFDAVGIRRLEGRTFNSGDRIGSDLVALVSQALASEIWGEADPIGEQFSFGGENSFHVVGVVSDVAYDTRGGTMGGVYLSHAQYAPDRNWDLTYTVRTAGPRFYEDARRELSGIDPALVLYRPRSLDAVLGGHRARDRFTFLLMAVFAVVALSLAAIGVYGVLAWAVDRRAQEIGIRLALGARTGQVRAMVARHALLVAGAGLGIGLAAAIALSRFLSSLVFGVSVRDPAVFAGVAILLGIVTLAAGIIPAVRASRVDPGEALRREA
jgi:putative ABC transport system permease protein